MTRFIRTFVSVSTLAAGGVATGLLSRHVAAQTDEQTRLQNILDRNHVVTVGERFVNYILRGAAEGGKLLAWDNQAKQSGRAGVL